MTREQAEEFVRLTAGMTTEEFDNVMEQVHALLNRSGRTSAEEAVHNHTGDHRPQA